MKNVYSGIEFIKLDPPLKVLKISDRHCMTLENKMSNLLKTLKGRADLTMTPRKLYQ